MNESGAVRSLDVNAVARICHEVNRAYCISLGDNSQPLWGAAPDWQKQSAVNGVEFHIGSALTAAEDSHVNWLKQKVAEGWVYGEVKNPEKKEHPCIVPFEDLPKEQQAKDYIFMQIVHSLQDFF